MSASALHDAHLGRVPIDTAHMALTICPLCQATFVSMWGLHQEGDELENTWYSVETSSGPFDTMQDLRVLLRDLLDELLASSGGPWSALR